ncbi:MAG: alpha-galactosidase [Spirochaetia bacterium]
MRIFSNQYYSLKALKDGGFSCSVSGGPEYILGGPVFPVDGRSVPSELDQTEKVSSYRIAVNGTREILIRGRLSALPGVLLETVFRVSQESPVFRFFYRLRGSGRHRLSARIPGSSGREQPLTYLSLHHPPAASLTEVRFSEFNEMIHSFSLVEEPVSPGMLDAGVSVMGPMLVQDRGDTACLLAYEHGSQYPDAFAAFKKGEDGRIVLGAVKGNYLEGEPLDQPEGFETIWFQFAAVGASAAVEGWNNGSPRTAPSPVDRLAAEYRRFQLRYATENLESRKPYIFYNTWAYQERNKWWNGKRFLDSMHRDRILEEIDRAHQMGIEVFVIDTGWYEKTGDWAVSRERFPDGLAAVRKALEERNMKLGLWFNPKVAAVSSGILKEYRDCVMSWQGMESAPHPIWETEESRGMCLVSRFWEAFADELIRLVKELGVTYFKWDAIDQYGCDSPNHFHGDESHSFRERADSYAFNLGRYMSKIVDKVCAACPGAIVDFDITEGNRYVGLGFLTSGKYFLINNGPYYKNFDVPDDPDRWTNIFVRPGPARGWFCRTPLTFDRWIPSVLFLTHYLPDDPADSQIINLASLMLGQNGIWGDLLSVSDEGVSLIAKLLGFYKQVRDDVTKADPVRIGTVGGGVEVHEKLSGEPGRGLVAAFTNGGTEYSFVTSRPVVRTFQTTTGAEVEIVGDGHAGIRVRKDAPGAVIVFFGAE